MDIQAIVERFALMADLTVEEATKWEDICKECAYQTYSKKKPGADSEQAEMALMSLAATLAFYRYCLYTNTNTSGENFKVGDISVSSDSSANNISTVQSALEEAKLAATPYMIDDAFSFKQVRS